VTAERDLPEQRILEQSMRLSPGGAVSGWAACRLHGASFFDGRLTDDRTEIPVPLAVGASGQLRTLAGSTVSRDRLDASEVVVRHGIGCTRPLRAVFDAARWAGGLREAVVALDMAFAAELTSRRRLRNYVLLRAGWAGVGKVRRALDLASEHSRSPNEVRMRLVWELDTGFARPLINRPVFDQRGRLLGIPDLLDPVAGVVGEYDGADHRGARRHSSDVDREGRLRDAGLELFRVTGPDLLDPAKVVRRMVATRSRARFLPPGHRAWTVEPPAGTEPELDLDEMLTVREMIHGGG